MAKDSGVNANAPHVKLRQGGNIQKPLGGVQQDEGVALLVSDTGRENFTAPVQVKLHVGTTATSMLQLIKAGMANGSAAQRTSMGMADASDVPSDIVAKRGFLFKADIANGGTVFIGGSEVAYGAVGAGNFASGMPLGAGDAMFIEVTRASSIFLDASAADQTIYWLAL